MKKNELRKKYLDLRKTLSEDEVLLFSEELFKRLILQFNITENQCVHVFLSIKKMKEVETFAFIKYLWERKVRVFVPKIKDGRMISVAYEPNTKLVESKWGIAEPIGEENECSSFDFVITPLLYCDGKGNRIGYGKGFYDVFFKEINQNTKKIGVNFFSPIDFIEDVEDTDIPLDYLVTPNEVLSFSFTSIFTK